jgi:hypothetical protein
VNEILQPTPFQFLDKFCCCEECPQCNRFFRLLSRHRCRVVAAPVPQHRAEENKDEGINDGPPYSNRVNNMHWNPRTTVDLENSTDKYFFNDCNSQGRTMAEIASYLRQSCEEGDFKDQIKMAERKDDPSAYVSLDTMLGHQSLLNVSIDQDGVTLVSSSEGIDMSILEESNWSLLSSPVPLSHHPGLYIPIKGELFNSIIEPCVDEVDNHDDDGYEEPRSSAAPRTRRNVEVQDDEWILRKGSELPFWTITTHHGALSLCRFTVSNP